MSPYQPDAPRCPIHDAPLVMYCARCRGASGGKAGKDAGALSPARAAHLAKLHAGNVVRNAAKREAKGRPAPRLPRETLEALALRLVRGELMGLIGGRRGPLRE